MSVALVAAGPLGISHAAFLSARYADWPHRLALYLQSRQHSPFEWLHNDCCTFAGNAVMVMTGKDPMRSIRARYTTQRGARRLIYKAGGLQALVVQHLGMPMEFATAAGRGDVVLLPDMAGQGPALGLCVGAEAVAAGESGTLIFPMSSAIAAWKI